MATPRSVWEIRFRTNRDRMELTVQYLTMKNMQAKRGGCGRNKIYQDVKDRVLPSPIRRGRTLYWVESEVDAAMQREAEMYRTKPVEVGQSNTGHLPA